MPLKIVARHTQKTKTKNLYIRGSYLGVAVDESARTDRHALAVKVRKRIEREIEQGEYGKKATQVDRGEPTFVSAAIAYLEAKRSPRYVQALVDYFGPTPLAEIDQAAIDEAAVALYPNGDPSYRNRAVYTPVSAILHHAKVEIAVARPKGAKGKRRTNWLTPADAFGIILAADGVDAELATLLVSLLYTGPRISAALEVRRADILLDEAAQWARPQKGQEPHAIKLQEDLLARLRELLARHDRERVFRWHYGGHLKFLLIRAKLAYLGLPCPTRRPVGWKQPPNRLQWVTFHSFRHTFLTWMRRYAKATIDDLNDLGTHRDRRTLQGYVHAAPDGTWDLVENLPAIPKKTA